MRGLPVVDEFGREVSEKPVSQTSTDVRAEYERLVGAASGKLGAKTDRTSGSLHSRLDEILSYLGGLGSVNLRLHEVANALTGPEPEDADGRSEQTVWEGMPVLERLDLVQEAVRRLVVDMDAVASRLERAVGR